MNQSTGYLLDKPIATTAAVIVFLQLDKLELSERLKDVLQVRLGDAKVDVAHIQPVEGNRVGMVTGRLSGSDLAVLLSFCKLYNDRNT
jgi:hypothetical protein